MYEKTLCMLSKLRINSVKKHQLRLNDVNSELFYANIIT
jgi:hypothetical protein